MTSLGTNECKRINPNATLNVKDDSEKAVTKETYSSESFYSCRSSNSGLTVQHLDDLEIIRNALFASQLGDDNEDVTSNHNGESNTNIMVVNAIFMNNNILGHSFNEGPTHCENTNNDTGYDGSESLADCLINSTFQPKDDTLSYIDCNNNADTQISKFSSPSIKSSKSGPDSVSLDISPKLNTSNTTIKSKIPKNTEPKPNLHEWGKQLRRSEHSNTSIKSRELPAFRFSIKKRKHSNLKPFSYKKMTTKMKFANIVTISDDNGIPVLLGENMGKTKKERNKKYTNKVDLGNSSSFCYGNCMENNKVKEKSLDIRNEKSVMLSVKEACIGKTPEDYQNRPKNEFSSNTKVSKGSKASMPFGGCPKHCKVANANNALEENKPKDRVVSKATNTDMIPKEHDKLPRSGSKHHFQNYNLKTYCLRLNEKSESIKQKAHESERKKYLKNKLTGSRSPSVRRKSSVMRTSLPVIEEESSCSTDSSDSSVDSTDNDFCLTDGLGNPILLFDQRGLPLTDWYGRPLRSIQGKLLMKFNEDGTPLVDENSKIFDAKGRRVYEKGFDPSTSPNNSVRGRLTNSYGHPLILFNVEGRPLTSLSGTMLVDSSGRTLVNLGNI